MKYNRALKEAFLDAFPYKSSWSSQSFVEAFKNPSTKEYNEIIKKQGYDGSRGVLTREGDLYLFAGEVLHDDVLAILAGRDIPGIDDSGDWFKNNKRLINFICIVTHAGKEIRLAESYIKAVRDKIITDYYDEYDFNLQQKNPSFVLVKK